MLAEFRRRRTLASFDYQWRQIPEGDAMLSDDWFRAQVEGILCGELLGVERDWFRGRSVLDAGCGGGRWTLGFLRLGAEVTAVDASESAIAYTRREMERLAPEPVAEGRLVTERVNLLEIPSSLAERRFDLVFSFGVLHHTGDTARALRNVSALVAPDGFLFLYLYGPRPLGHRLFLGLARSLAAPLPFRAKRALLQRLFAGRDVHQCFDLYSPLVNDIHHFDTVRALLLELGFAEVTRTLEHGELFLRASRKECSASPFRPPPPRPYWFERYRRRR
jgi:SAM-dependent methyltransferase